MSDEALDELELVVPRRVVFERLALRHRNNGKAKGLSIPIVRNNTFRLSVPMFYRPNTTVLEVTIDCHLFQR